MILLDLTNFPNLRFLPFLIMGNFPNRHNNLFQSIVDVTLRYDLLDLGKHQLGAEILALQIQPDTGKLLLGVWESKCELSG